MWLSSLVFSIHSSNFAGVVNSLFAVVVVVMFVVVFVSVIVIVVVAALNLIHFRFRLDRSV